MARLEIYRSKWVLAKLAAGCAAMALMFLLLVFVATMSTAVRYGFVAVSLAMGLCSCSLLVALSQRLPTCVIDERGFHFLRSAFSRKLTFVPWVGIQSAQLVDISPMASSVNGKHAFGEPAIRLRLVRRIGLSHTVMILVGRANYSPEQICTSIRRHIAAT